MKDDAANNKNGLVFILGFEKKSWQLCWYDADLDFDGAGSLGKVPEDDVTEEGGVD